MSKATLCTTKHCPTCTCEEPALKELNLCINCGVQMPDCKLAVVYHSDRLGRPESHVVYHEHPNVKCVVYS